MSSPQPGPVTDSPLFWLLLFGSMGLVMLTVVEPKFIKRQERIDRMHQSRQRTLRQAPQASDGAGGQLANRAETPVWRPGKQASLRPLMLFMAGVLVTAMIAMQLRRRKMIAACQRAPADTNPGPTS